MISIILVSGGVIVSMGAITVSKGVVSYANQADHVGKTGQ